MVGSGSACALCLGVVGICTCSLGAPPHHLVCGECSTLQLSRPGCSGQLTGPREAGRQRALRFAVCPQEAGQPGSCL